MNIAVLGYGSQGRAAVEYWNTPENTITVCDQSTEITVPEGVATQLGETYLENLDRFDLLVRTPIMHPSTITAANPTAPDILRKVTTVTNEFIKVCPSRNIIAVTGTKGKGTTSTLLSKMLQASGRRVHLGGNIGLPPLDMLKGKGALDEGVTEISADDWVVLELANFQLIDLKHSPHIAVCLMVEPEHLDWHEDVEEYIAAKQQLFINQSEDDIAIYYAKNETSLDVAAASEGTLIPYFDQPGAVVANGKLTIDGVDICAVEDFKLPGEHNWQNICAATTALWQVAHDFAAIKTAVSEFSGLPFRIEHRRTIGGISYYDDSFATGPGATKAAIAAIKQKKVLIIGGYDRGLSLEPLADYIKEHDQDIRKVVLVGASAGRMKETLEQKGFDNYAEESSKDMAAIVATASTYAHSGDAVVLSPAFASFDMFKNFEDRGIKFNAAVDAL